MTKICLLARYKNGFKLTAQLHTLCRHQGLCEGKRKGQGWHLMDLRTGDSNRLPGDQQLYLGRCSTFSKAEYRVHGGLPKGLGRPSLRNLPKLTPQGSQARVDRRKTAGVETKVNTMGRTGMRKVIKGKVGRNGQKQEIPTCFEHYAKNYKYESL